jgi:hypothetical protein
MFDMVNCLQLAQGDLDNDLRTETRDSIVALVRMDATEVDSGISALRTLAQHMRHVEEQLDAAGRRFAMRKVRSVRQRAEQRLHSRPLRGLPRALGAGPTLLAKTHRLS